MDKLINKKQTFYAKHMCSQRNRINVNVIHTKYKGEFQIKQMFGKGSFFHPQKSVPILISNENTRF